MLKVLTLILVAYVLYRYVFKASKPIPPPQEPEIFIKHEEVILEDEENK